MISIERLRELFDYNPTTGELYRKFNSCSEVIATGLRLEGKHYPVANIAWALHYGEWPVTILDHKDRDRYNNEITNLRLATHSQNGMNQKHYNPHGMKGISYDPTRKKCWRAQIRIGGVKVNLGRYYTKEEASEVYRQASLKYHGEFACHD